MSRITSRGHDFRGLVTLIALAIFISGCFDLAHAQQRAQPTFLKASEREIRARRIKRNERDTIQFCRGTVTFILTLYQFGPLLTPAKTEERSETHPISGYYYRALTGQGRHAAGGAKKYVVNGWISGGFALVAYPAEYGSSGVMTFIVNLDGNVYQKDLGPETSSCAKSMTEYDPDASWKKVN